MKIEPESPESCARLLTALEKSGGKALCAACGALAGKLSLMEARRAIADLSSAGKAALTHDGVCGVCGRRQEVLSQR